MYLEISKKDAVRMKQETGTGDFRKDYHRY